MGGGQTLKEETAASITGPGECCFQPLRFKRNRPS